MPDTVALPTVVPPVVHPVGGTDSGPKTLKVTVPVALEPDVPERVDPIEPDEIAVLIESVAGPEAVAVGLAFATTVSDIPDPHLLVAALLLASPP